MANLVLLCPRHHTEIHAEQWAVEVRDGVPWFVPPPWVDPDRAPVRNTLRSALERTVVVAQQLTTAPRRDRPPHTAGGPISSSGVL